MEKEAFNALLKKYEDGQCTPEEIAYVESWFLKFAEDSPLLAAQPDYDAIDAELRTRLGLPLGEVRGTPKTYRVRMVLRYVAAILVFIAAGIGIYQYTSDKGPDQQLTAQYDDIPPGTNRATMTLANGETIELSELQQEVVVTDGAIEYSNGNQITQTDEVQYATLATPRAGQYQITLADSTKVWLNAESSIRYPTSFTGNNREVEIKGEAYFEVTHDSNHPFIVKSNGQQIEVLGTAFNVSAYADGNTVTTLVSGSVQLKNEHTVRLLSPNQQAVLRNNSFQITNVDVQIYTAWKDGFLVLDNADLATIAKHIERWYDVEFVLPAAHHTEPLFGSISRNANLSEILKTLEKNYNLKFKMEGRRITVSN